VERFVIAVTGAAGFIGGNLVSALAEAGERVLAVDSAHTPPGRPFDAYIEKDAFAERLERDGPFAASIRAVLHQGACSDTSTRDRRFLRENNARFSRRLARACVHHGVQFIYASSAAVYGATPGRERPLNEYAHFKAVFDRYVRAFLTGASSQIVGLRYFNVYGPGETHKASMASIVLQLHLVLERRGRVRLFAGTHGRADGEQRRDFVHVDDVVDVNLWFLAHPDRSGIFDVGTGWSRSFNEVAQLVIDSHGHGSIEYVPMPLDLQARYQSFTEADLEPLRRAGYTRGFVPLEEGVPHYLEQLSSKYVVA
jgi:ADP-L-glycero-D-manno-heptose 6-epimerase